MNRAHGGPLFLQFLDPDVTEVKVVGFPVILQGNVSFQRTITDAGLFSFAFLVELVVDDLLAVELDLQVVALAGNDHLVGGEGYDIIKGNSGDDKLTGGPGFDVIDGGDDHDTSYDSASDIVIKCEEEL